MDFEPDGGGVFKQSDGSITGWAWADNLGWIKFGGLSDFPVGPGTESENAYVDGAGVVHGWARACAGTDSQDDAIASWDFDEGSGLTATDSSFYENTATLQNGVTWGAGYQGTAVSFDGVNDYVSVVQSASLDRIYNNGGGGMSVSFWIKPDVLGSVGIMSLGQGSDTEWDIYTNAAGRLGFEVPHDGGGVLNERFDNQLIAGQWNHFVITWNGNNTSAAGVRLYRNGVQQPFSFGSSGVGNPVDNSNEPFLIGTNYAGGSGFDGSLDEVRIYDRVLSALDAETLYENSLSGFTPVSGQCNPEGQIYYCDKYSPQPNASFHHVYVGCKTAPFTLDASNYLTDSQYECVTTDEGACLEYYDFGQWWYLPISNSFSEIAPSVCSSSGYTTLGYTKFQCDSVDDISRADGWDGWISLEGDGYAMSYLAGVNALTGWAWGSDVIGWLNCVSDCELLASSGGVVLESFSTQRSHQQVTVTNNTYATAPAVRISYNPVLNVTAPNVYNVTPWNNSGTDNVGRVYFQHNYPLAPGESVTFDAQFSHPVGGGPSVVVYTLDPASAIPEPELSPSAIPVASTVTVGSGYVSVAFTTLSGRWYAIQYRDGPTDSWHTAFGRNSGSAMLFGSGSSGFWLDRGAPHTKSLPSPASVREYQVYLLPTTGDFGGSGAGGIFPPLACNGPTTELSVVPGVCDIGDATQSEVNALLFIESASPVTYNSLTGLYSQDVTVSNNTGSALPGIRLRVTNLTSGTLWNPSGNDGTYNFLQHNYAVPHGASVTFRVLIQSASLPLPSYSVLAVASLSEPSLPSGSALVTIGALEYQSSSNQTILKWTSEAGYSYTIQYTDDGGTTWRTMFGLNSGSAVPQPLPVAGSGYAQQTIDLGSPISQSPPTGTRVYRMYKFLSGNNSIPSVSASYTIPMLPTTMSLSWDRVATFENDVGQTIPVEGYYVMRSGGSQSAKFFVANPPSGSTVTYTDRGLNPGGIYSYSVSIVGGGEEFPPANTVYQAAPDNCLEVHRVDNSLSPIGGTKTRLDSTDVFDFDLGTDNPKVFINISETTHTVDVTELTGQSVVAGVCAHPRDGDCTPAFTAPITDLGTYLRSSFTHPVPSHYLGYITKFVFKYGNFPAPQSVTGVPQCQDESLIIARIVVEWDPPTPAPTSYEVDVKRLGVSLSGYPVNVGTSLIHTIPNITIAGTYDIFVTAIHAGGNAVSGVSVAVVPETICTPNDLVALSCTFSPANSTTLPVVGRPLEFQAYITGGTEPYTVRWQDSDGLDFTQTEVYGSEQTLTRVYSRVGKKSLVITTTDSEGEVDICALSVTQGPDLKLTPVFDEY